MLTFVINLPGSVERRATMDRQLAGLGLEVEFVDALDGRRLDRREHPTASGLLDAELGCYLSHLAVWRRLIASGRDCAIVLEDDAVVAPDLAAQCAEFSGLPERPDMVRISSVKQPAGIEIRKLASGRRVLLPTEHPSGCQGYWLTRDGARKFLDCLSRPRIAIDCALDRYWRYGLRVFLLDPPAVRERSGIASTIGERSRNHRRNRIARKFEKWQRHFAVRRILARLRRRPQAAPR
ncbi:glycosyltransferase family 25 protein [Solimonas terrae]|uniref:Glycosyltransferase family 25 protein n=1 Tax=Solimonas terrae TaxID=1396819 RepID=A0A6M2BWS5_9GAMM|nr:glycosyltransferase family 25 protein [Solimonas terrae]NGY06735.1 glycosyltransferase family 25 protein [Solimonas terrae]